MVESKNYAWNVNAVSKDVYFYFETKVNQLRQVLEKKRLLYLVPESGGTCWL